MKRNFLIFVLLPLLWVAVPAFAQESPRLLEAGGVKIRKEAMPTQVLKHDRLGKYFESRDSRVLDTNFTGVARAVIYSAVGGAPPRGLKLREKLFLYATSYARRFDNTETEFHDGIASDFLCIGAKNGRELPEDFAAIVIQKLYLVTNEEKEFLLEVNQITAVPACGRLEIYHLSWEISPPSRPWPLKVKGCEISVEMSIASR